jgi:hypothetical protein
MASEQTSTSRGGQEGRLIIRADDGTTFVIPRAVVERGRVEGEPAAELERLIEAGDVSGFSGGVVLPYAGDQAVYALPAETLIQYRLSPEEAQALPGEIESDATGFNISWPCPPGHYLVGLGPGGAITSKSRCIPYGLKAFSFYSTDAAAPTSRWVTAAWG